MYKNIFDSHAHYDDEKFDSDRLELVGSLPDKGIVNVVNCASDIRSARMCVALARSFPFVYAAVGIHPHECGKADKSVDIAELKALLAMDRVVAVGEIGLDYHYDFSPREVQQQWLELQLRLALEYDLPVIIHDREAHADTYALLKKYKPRGVIHCFSGSAESALEVVSWGMYIGIGGAVTFNNAKMPARVVSAIPRERLLIETDCPYMTPVPFRGKRCDSSYIPYTAEKIGELLSITPQEVLDLTCENARRMFFEKS